MSARSPSVRPRVRHAPGPPLYSVWGPDMKGQTSLPNQLRDVCAGVCDVRSCGMFEIPCMQRLFVHASAPESREGAHVMQRVHCVPYEWLVIMGA